MTCVHRQYFGAYQAASESHPSPSGVGSLDAAFVAAFVDAFEVAAFVNVVASAFAALESVVLVIAASYVVRTFALASVQAMVRALGSSSPFYPMLGVVQMEVY